MSTETESSSASVSVITGVIGVDCHIIGSWLITHVLEQAGFKVHMLGCNVSQEEFVDAAIETHARALVISSLGGLAIIDSRGLREKCEESGLKDILLYIGGNLSSNQAPWSEIEEEFKAEGFNRVYPMDADLRAFVRDLNTDLGLSLDQLTTGVN